MVRGGEGGVGMVRGGRKSWDGEGREGGVGMGRGGRVELGW